MGRSSASKSVNIFGDYRNQENGSSSTHNWPPNFLIAIFNSNIQTKNPLSNKSSSSASSSYLLCTFFVFLGAIQPTQKWKWPFCGGLPAFFSKPTFHSKNQALCQWSVLTLFVLFFFFLKFLNNMHQFLCLCVCVFNLLVYQIVMRVLFRSVDLNFFLVFNQIDRMSPGLFWCSALTLLVLFLNFLIICMNFCFVFWVNYILMWVLFGSLVSVPFLGFNPFNFIFVGIFCSAFTLCSFFLFCF